MNTVSEMRQHAQLEDLTERKFARAVILGTMPYGKYKGLSIVDTVRDHPHYCEGLARRLKCDCYSSKTLKNIIIALIGVDQRGATP